jgi:hypothetical protein
VQMPSSEDPLSFRIQMRQSAHSPLVRLGNHNSHRMNKRRHECRRYQ